MAFVRLSSNKSSASAFPKVSITLRYYRYSIICRANIVYSIKKPVLLALYENQAWVRGSTLVHSSAFARMIACNSSRWKPRCPRIALNGIGSDTLGKRRSGDAVVGACHSHAIAPTYG